MLPLREKADHGGGDRNQAIPITARPSHKMNNRTVRGRPPDHQKGGSVRRNRRVVRAITVTRRFFLIFSKDPFTAAWSGKEAVHATSRHFRPDPLASGKEAHPGFPATKKPARPRRPCAGRIGRNFFGFCPITPPDTAPHPPPPPGIRSRGGPGGGPFLPAESAALPSRDPPSGKRGRSDRRGFQFPDS